MTINSTDVLYEINAHTYLNKLSRKYGHSITLATVPDEELERLANLGIGAVWLMGVWERSPSSIDIGRKDAGLQASFSEILPDMQEDDFIGSAYAIRAYSVDQRLGGKEELAALRTRLATRDIRLVLDFVPNHTAPDHPWVSDHPEFYISGTEEELANDPESYIDCNGTILANGRDPQYPAWTDVVQLNAFSPVYRQEAMSTLQSIAAQCDGVRCDMAMLLMNDIFEQSWGHKAGAKPQTDFWVEVIGGVRAVSPDFIFLAETYWDTEQDLNIQGFDYCYDKTLYDLLLGDDVEAIIGHLHKTNAYQNHLARFVENHDEERAAVAYTHKKKAAAVIIATLPGLWLFHDGQAEGFKTKIPVHLARGPYEEVDQELYAFYTHLLTILHDWNLSQGTWHLLDNDNKSIIAMEWTVKDTKHLVIVNYSDAHSHVAVSLQNDVSSHMTFRDALTGHEYKTQFDHRELDCDIAPWQVLMLTLAAG